MCAIRLVAFASCLAPALAGAGDYPANCAPQPACNAPGYVPPCQPLAPAAPAPAVQPGMFAQPPAVGDVQGEANGWGVRGLAIQIPEINLQLPTLKLPSTFKYRRGPQMQVDSATAGYVTGPAANFGMMAVAPAVAPAAPPAPATMPPAPYQCVPPAPACEPHGALESRLLDELLRKDQQLREMNARFSQLDSTINRMAERSQPSSHEAPAIVSSSYEEPAPIPRPLPASTVKITNRKSAAPMPEAPQAATARQAATSKPAVSKSVELGVWSESQSRSSATTNLLGVELSDPFK